MLEPIFENIRFQDKRYRQWKVTDFEQVKEIQQEKKKGSDGGHREKNALLMMLKPNKCVCEKSIPGIQTSRCKPAEARSLSG